MMLRNNKFLFGAALPVFVGVLLAGGMFLAHADENSESDAIENSNSNSGDANEGDVTDKSASDRKTPWVRAHDLATERKLQVENDSMQKRAFMEGNAEDRKAQREENMSDRQQNLCTTMVERNEKLSQRLGDAQKTIMSRKATRRNVFDENRDERDATLETNRNERDMKREEMYAKLLERAGDDTKKQAAVAAFKAAVETAVANRKQAVDAAIEAFRTGVDAAIGSKKTTVDSSLATFKTAVDAAFATAKSGCESGTDPATVRETLQASLKAARASMGSERKDADTVGEQVRSLAEAKKTSFATALSEFKLAMEQARADLKAAFGTTESESESNS